MEILQNIIPYSKDKIERWAFPIYLLYVFAIPFKIPSFFLTLLAILLLIFIIFKIFMKEWVWSKFDYLVILFSFTLLLSTVLSIDKTLSLKYMKRDILSGLLIYFSTAQLIDYYRLKWFIRTLLLSFGVAVMLSFGHWGHDRKLYGIFGHHTRYGKFLDISIPFTLPILFSENIYTAIFCLLLLLSSLYSLILTMSRGAWIGVFASVLFILILIKRWYVFPIIVVLVVLILPLTPLKKDIEHRAMSVVTLPTSVRTDISLSSRVEYYKTALRLIEMRPILGWGYGRKMPRMIRKKLGKNWFKRRGLVSFKSHAHNSYLELALESGVLGLASFLVLIIVFVLRGWRLFIYSTDPYIRATVLGMVGGMLALLIHGLVDNIFQKPYIAYMFVFIGTVFAMERIMERIDE